MSARRTANSPDSFRKLIAALRNLQTELRRDVERRDAFTAELREWRREGAAVLAVNPALTIVPAVVE